MIYDEDPFRRRPENRWPGENDRRGVSEWRKIWANGLPDESDLQNEAIGWLRKGCYSLGGGTGGTISTDLDVVWGMSVYILTKAIGNLDIKPHLSKKAVE